jgi:hypothetical protein
MMKRFFALTLILIMAACTSPDAFPDAEKANIIQEVKQTLENYCKDIGSSGLKAEFRYLDSSADFFWVPPGYSGAISYDSVATVIRRNAPKYRSVNNSFTSLRIIPLTSRLATYTGTLSSAMTDSLNKVTVFSLVETGVMIKRKEGWKLLHGQTAVVDQ